MASKSYETSTGEHPFIVNPSAWVGVPWDNASKPTPREKTNEDLILELHDRISRNQNVADLFNETKRTATVEQKRSAKEKSGKKKTIMQSSEKTVEACDLNPFSEELKAKRLPFEVYILFLIYLLLSLYTDVKFCADSNTSCMDIANRIFSEES